MDFDKARQLLNGMGGLCETLGIQVTLEDDAPCCRMEIEDRHTGAPGVAHGGSITTLMDTALGAHALAQALGQQRMAATVEIKVNFLRPARVGDVLVTSTKLQAAGRSLLVVSGEAHVEGSDERVAFATGTFNLYNLDKVDW